MEISPYSRTFLKSLAVSIPSVSLPITLFMGSSAPSGEECGRSPDVSSGGGDPAEFRNAIGTASSAGFSGADVLEMAEGDMEDNEYCPTEEGDPRRNPRHCRTLRWIVGALNRIRPGFADRVHLHLPEGGDIPLKEALRGGGEKAQEAFKIYFSGDIPLIYTLRKKLTLHSGIAMSGYTRSKVGEIGRFLPEEKSRGNYENWRYLAIMERLAENGERVVLRPMELYSYYHLLRDPRRRGLMVEEARHFYFSGGSKWAGWRNKKYILNFSDALEEYLPKKSTK